MFTKLAILLGFATVALGQGGLGHQQLGQGGLGHQQLGQGGLGHQQLGNGYGNEYGGHGHLNQAVGSYGQGHNAGQSLYGNQAYGNQGQYGGGLAQHHSAHGGQQGVNDVHHNRGVYARNKGRGYEKAFAYDKTYSVQDNGGQLNGHGGYYGTNSGLQAKQHGGHGSFGQSAFGGEGHQAGYGQGQQGLLNSGYGNYRNNYGQGQLIQQGGHGYGK